MTNRWSPWREIDRLQRQLNDVFGRWGIDRATEFPPVNVWTNEEGAVLTTELPGIDPKQIEISVLGDTLTLEGRRDALQIEEGRTAHRRERGSGPFNRTIQLPFRVDGTKVEASYVRGVLEIHAPKAAEDRPRSITVTAE